MLTALAVWSVFVVSMGILFPVPTTNNVSTIEQTLQSFTVYGFFSLLPIVFYGAGVSYIADWTARAFSKQHEHFTSFLMHITGALIAAPFFDFPDAFMFTLIAAVLFFVLDRTFALLSLRPFEAFLTRRCALFIGLNGAFATMIGGIMT